MSWKVFTGSDPAKELNSIKYTYSVTIAEISNCIVMNIGVKVVIRPVSPTWRITSITSILRHRSLKIASKTSEKRRGKRSRNNNYLPKTGRPRICYSTEFGVNWRKMTLVRSTQQRNGLVRGSPKLKRERHQGNKTSQCLVCRSKKMRRILLMKSVRERWDLKSAVKVMDSYWWIRWHFLRRMKTKTGQLEVFTRPNASSNTAVKWMMIERMV